MTKDTTLQVLLVEDNPDDVAAVQRLTAQSPVPVRLTVATSGRDALAYLAHCRTARAVRPQVILLDIRLPEIDGIEVLRRLSAEPQAATITTILLSGSDDDSYVRAGQELGAHSHVLKPMTASNFQWIVKSVQRYLGRVATMPPSR